LHAQVVEHPGTYDEYAEFLAQRTVGRLGALLADEGHVLWHVSSACVRGCVQLIVW
jgi:hypothetical protein